MKNSTIIWDCEKEVGWEKELWYGGSHKAFS